VSANGRSTIVYFTARYSVTVGIVKHPLSVELVEKPFGLEAPQGPVELNEQTGAPRDGEGELLPHEEPVDGDEIAREAPGDVVADRVR